MPASCRRAPVAKPSAMVSAILQSSPALPTMLA
jgi:hypothetical protein